MCSHVVHSGAAGSAETATYAPRPVGKEGLPRSLFQSHCLREPDWAIAVQLRMAVRPPLPPPKRAQARSDLLGSTKCREVPAEPVGELVPEAPPGFMSVSERRWQVEEATGQAPMPQAPATPLARKPEAGRNSR